MNKFKSIKNNNTKCPTCNKIISSDFIVINGGAMKYIDKNNSSMLEPNDQGFLTIVNHSSDPHKIHTINITKLNESNSGQFDLYFCNTTCLANFFNKIIQTLNKK